MRCIQSASAMSGAVPGSIASAASTNASISRR